MAIRSLGTQPSQSIIQRLNALAEESSRTSARLASGRRIGGAGGRDQAALIGIAQSIGAQVRGLGQQSANAQIGVIVTQTAEAGLSEVSDLLQRGRELALQASNETLSSNDRAALQQEFAQVQQAIDQTASNTQFNGRSLLDGSTSSLTVAAGGSGASLTVALPNATTASLGLSSASLDSAAGRRPPTRSTALLSR